MMWTTELPVAAGLIIWTALCLLLAAHAESAVTRICPPRPWLAGAYSLTVAVLAISLHPQPAIAAAYGTTCIALIVAAGPDSRVGYLFDAITLPAALVVLAIVSVSGAAQQALGGVLLLVGAFGTLIAYSRGRWMGLGDVKAMYAMGAAFGPLESLVAIFVACISGIAVTGLFHRRSLRRELPFGPHLAVGAVFALVAGDPVLQNVFGFRS